MSQSNAAKNAEIKSHFQTPSQKEFFAGEELTVYDCDQLMTYERAFARSNLGRTHDGLPPMSVVLTVWWKIRNSWARVVESLPPSPLRDEMTRFLGERDAMMTLLRNGARKLQTGEEADDQI